MENGGAGNGKAMTIRGHVQQRNGTTNRGLTDALCAGEEDLTLVERVSGGGRLALEWVHG